MPPYMPFNFYGSNRKGGILLVILINITSFIGCASTPQAQKDEKYQSANAYIELAIVYIKEEKMDKALIQLKKSESIALTNPELKHAYAIYYQKTGDIEQAEKYFKAALFKQPSNPRYNNNYGVLLSQLKRNEEAQERFQIAYSQEDYSNRASAYENYGDIKRQTGEYIESINAYSEALKLNPDWFIIYLKIAQANYNSGNFVAANNSFDSYLVNLEKANISPSLQDIELGLAIAASIKDYEKVTEYQKVLENRF